jgi:hypothetical protein
MIVGRAFQYPSVKHPASSNELKKAYLRALEVIPWQIKIKSVHIPVAIVQFKVEIHFVVINAASKVLAHLASAAIRVVAIIKSDGRASRSPLHFIERL